MPEKRQNPDSNRIVRLDEVIDRTGLSRSTIYDKMDPKSPRHDRTFPPRVKLGLSAIGWEESALDSWILTRIHANRSLPASVQDHAPPKPELQEAPATSTQKSTQTDSARSSDVAVVYDLLERHAKTGTFMPYKQVMDPVRLWPDLPKDRVQVEQILERVTRKSHLEGKGLFGVLVQESLNGNSRPSDGFFRLATELGYSYANPDVFVQEQIERLFEFYEQPSSKSKGGVLIWINSRGKNFLTRTQKFK
ncbi:MAG: AlpA family phage regulatory protein [Polaromonas sp.]|uniref:helix-turn-helix transcriptional regulator n=1 Tax=Polaromonas sp. TaxID=1869339 RepID=UPI0024880F12|nr:AlpA family phage regulatory protein [Polaromonas sp.]MDI1269460.1 AlpA family phage regulatory protein [Polaromonas sp.]